MSYKKLSTQAVAGIVLIVLIFVAARKFDQQNLESQALHEQINKLGSELSEKKVELQQAEKDQSDGQNLGQYALNMMFKTYGGRQLSNAKKQSLARSIVRVANDIFDSYEHKKAFVAILAIESQFQKFAQSPTGPKGYSQVAKAAFKEAMQRCGQGSATEDDIWDTELNILAGACYFRAQIEENHGDHLIAMVAYNQGPASDSVKTYAKSGDLSNLEVLKYMAKYTFLQRTVSDKKVAGVPEYSPGKEEASSKTKKPASQGHGAR